MDKLLLESVVNDIKKEHDFDPTIQKKQCFKLLNEIEKSRIALSADTQAQFSVEELTEDISLEYQITQEEFELSVTKESELKEKLEQFLRKTVEECTINENEISRIELLGEASRTPLFE